MHKLTILFFSLTISCYSLADSITINRRLDDLEYKLKRFESNEQNYKLEKDLLKETYSNNYERISLMITIILGVIGILGYLGIRDISSIKKEYKKELNNLRNIQGRFNLKSEEFEKDKKKFEEDLKAIIKENEEQGKKIAFIELKEKARTLLKDDNLTSALEFTNTALDLSKNDLSMLNLKGRILTRLNQVKDAADTFQLAIKISPTDSSTIFNTVECLYFAKDIQTAKKLIEEHKVLFESKDNGRLLKFLNLIELYHSANEDKLIEIAKSYVDINNLKTTSKKIIGWDLKEAHYFAYFQPEGELKVILQNIIRYWDGLLTGENLLKNIGSEVPNPLQPQLAPKEEEKKDL
jgi:hypothetical protein